MLQDTKLKLILNLNSEHQLASGYSYGDFVVIQFG